MTRQQFVTKYWPLAVAVGQQFGLSPVAIIAHALKESGAGNERAAARHNYFGFLKAGKHLVYESDEAGFRAYALRLSTRFPEAAIRSGKALDFASAVAYSGYVNESMPAKVKYAQTLAMIYKAVAKDVQQLGLPTDLVATTTSAGNPNTI